MSDRTTILARIKEALTLSAPIPGQSHGESGPVPTEANAASHIHEWLPSVGESLDSRLALFLKNSEDFKTDFRIFDSSEDLERALLDMAAEWKKIAIHSGELTDPIRAKLDVPVCSTDGGYDVAELESCDAGITECDALIAQTGSILVTSRSAGGRALSVLPPHHIVIARREQLLADLPDAFALLESKYAADYPSFISLITGPSRTGDIERILVLGAHGPKRLTVLCF